MRVVGNTANGSQQVERIDCMKKYLALLLTCLLAVPFTGCKKGDDVLPPPQDTGDSAETDFADRFHPDDCKGYEFTLLTRNCCVSHVAGFWADVDSKSDAVSNAVFSRTSAVESKLGCFLSYDTVADGYPEKLVVAENGNMKICDVALIHAQYIGAVALSGNLLDMGKIKSIEWERPWWNRVVIEANSIDGHFFAARGVIDVNSLTELSCLYFNKNILASEFSTETDLFRTVSDGKWTFERMGEMARQVGRDMNSDGKMTLEDDQFGFVTEPGYMNIWQYALGAMTTVRNETGIPVLCGYSERLQLIVDGMRSLIWGGNGNWCETNATTAKTLERTLFMMGQLSDVVNDEDFRRLQNVYGILPLPKYAESERYVSHAVGHSDQIGIPRSARGDLEKVTQILEALVYFGYEIIRPAVYEEALQYRYVSDPYSGGAMLDIILDSVTSDFAEFAAASDQSLLHKQTYLMDKLTGTDNSIGLKGYLKTLDGEGGASSVLAKYVEQFRQYAED